MDSLFDEVSRILAQPRGRRSALRIVLGTAAGALVGGGAKAGTAFAWAPQPCAGGTQTCNFDQGTTCCGDPKSLLSRCCPNGVCTTTADGAGVCAPSGGGGGCPSGTALCGSTCCDTATTTCCNGMCCQTVATGSGPATQTCQINGSGVEVCVAVVVGPPPG